MSNTTTFLVKTDKTLKKNASDMAREIGVPLSTVVNAYLKQFVRDGKLSLSVDEHVAPKKMKEWLKISEAMDNGEMVGVTAKNTDELFAHLGV